MLSSDSVTGLWSRYYPQIEKLLVDNLLEITEDKILSDDVLSILILKVYELLPAVARLTLSRDLFLKLVLKGKKPILDKVSKIREKRRSSVS